MRKGSEIITWKHGTRIGIKNQELGTRNKKNPALLPGFWILY